MSIAGQTEGITELVAVLIAVTDLSARVLTVHNGCLLPSGPLSPIHHSLQSCVRTWVRETTKQPMGYVEQLYTLVDINRMRDTGQPAVYISYLGLVSEAAENTLEESAYWQDCYSYFPWEDRRFGIPLWLQTDFYPLLDEWINSASNTTERAARKKRVNMCWGRAEYAWVEDFVLLRYELMYEVGMIQESPSFQSERIDSSLLGLTMNNDHRRILATALARTRAKIKYRPVIFELMPTEFTLFQLQKSIEALSGVELHKPNFRRMIQNQDLLEATGQTRQLQKGRPARLYRFKEDILVESLLSGTKLPYAKS